MIGRIKSILIPNSKESKMKKVTKRRHHKYTSNYQIISIIQEKYKLKQDDLPQLYDQVFDPKSKFILFLTFIEIHLLQDVLNPNVVKNPLETNDDRNKDVIKKMEDGIRVSIKNQEMEVLKIPLKTDETIANRRTKISIENLCEK